MKPCLWALSPTNHPAPAHPAPLTHVMLAGNVAEDSVALGQLGLAIDEIGQLKGQSKDDQQELLLLQFLPATAIPFARSFCLCKTSPF